MSVVRVKQPGLYPVHAVQNGSVALPLSVTFLHVPFNVFTIQVYELNAAKMPGVRLLLVLICACLLCDHIILPRIPVWQLAF